MLTPAPYDYDTETFDKEAAFRHVLDYPAFENAFSNHTQQHQITEYVQLSRFITGSMELSYEARKRYKVEKEEYILLYKNALQVAGYSALICLAILALSFLGPLMAYQTLIWGGLGILVLVFIGLPLAAIITMARDAYDDAEKALKEIHEEDRWIREFYAMSYISDMQDGMLALMPSRFESLSIKTRSIH